MQKLKVIKIGGNVIDNPDKLQVFLREFAAIQGLKILVHGGGKVATKVAAGLGIEAVMIDGRRVTDGRMLEVVTMVYGGTINKGIVSSLQALGCNAIGLTGADGGFITALRRSAVPVDYGFVGDPVGVNLATAQVLLGNGLVPIVAPLTYADGALLNTNADTVAQTVATALSRVFSTELIYLFEKRGVLRDVNNDDSVIEYITPAILQQLKADGVVDKGMLPKLENAFAAIDAGVHQVNIGQTIICNTIS
ncbi:MAG: acetylglutamate kinase [Mucinivorans sp.]